MGRRIFDLDLSRCIGCFACVVACNDQHDTQEEETPSLRRVVRYEDMGTGSTKFVSVGCMHCEEAPCAAACPTGAVQRDEELGLTVVDPSQCIGCHSCLMACPVGAPKFGADHRMHKCDGCIDRQRVGLAPVCVKTCPSGALRLREEGEDPLSKTGLRSLLFPAAGS